MVDGSALPASARGPAPVSVRDWRPDDEAGWDAFVLEQPRATFFHQIGWKRVLEATFGYPACYLVAERDGEMCGILPMFACRSIRGQLGLYSLPHTVYGGPVGVDAAVEQAMLARVIEMSEELGTHSVEFRNRHATLLEMPALDGFVTFEKELPASPEDVYRTFPKKAREMINQARKRHKLEADFAGDLGAFYPLLADSYRNLGTPVFPKSFFAAMLREFAPTSSILIVRHQDDPIAGVLSMEFRNTMMPIYSGEAAGAGRLKPNNFKYFRLMEYAVDRNLGRFDFGRSRLSNQGVVKFKVRQGFEAEALPYQTLVPTPSGIDPNRGIFAKVRRVWRKLPRPVARMAGPAIVKYFP